jgi:hypothetical protein
MLLRIFGNARTDDREVFFLLAPRRTRIDKRSCAGSKVLILDQATSDLFILSTLSRPFAVGNAPSFKGANCTSNAKSLQDDAN